MRETVPLGVMARFCHSGPGFEPWSQPQVVPQPGESSVHTKSQPSETATNSHEPKPTVAALTVLLELQAVDVDGERGARVGEAELIERHVLQHGRARPPLHQRAEGYVELFAATVEVGRESRQQSGAQEDRCCTHQDVAAAPDEDEPHEPTAG